MDEKGYTFTPLVFLLIIPVVIVAASYSDISNEINMISQIAIGGDTTYSTATNILTTIEKSTKDAGRNAAYTATRCVIDNEALRKSNPFFSQSGTNTSKSYIRKEIVDNLNNNTLETCKKLEAETGRQIYIKNIPITNYTTSVFAESDIEINQDGIDPFGFNVVVKSGIPITVAQNDQNYTGYTPNNMVVYVSIIGLEDPYIWVKSKDRVSTVFDKYPYYTSYNKEFHFDDDVDRVNNRLYKMWDCLNGTNGISGIAHRPYYFSDSKGLTFFDRLEGRTNTTSQGPNDAKMSTFVLGNPLSEEYFPVNASCVDHEYFDKIPGNRITISGNTFYDPWPYGIPTPVYISPAYRTIFGIKSSY